MLALLVDIALGAAPSGFKVTEADYNGCELSLGPAEADGVVPMRAECVWSDVSLDRFKAVMSDYTQHDEVWATVAESKVQRTDGDRSLVYQKHQNSGINDREILLWMKHESVDGYDRYSWTRATGETLTAADGNVLTARSDGYWQAKAEGTGIRVVHLLSYDPGGSVPGFIIRWFQTSGLEANVDDLHAYLKKG